MSSYAASARAGVYGDAVSEVSVGDILNSRQLYSTTHPLYKKYTEQLSRNLATVLERETRKLKNAQLAVATPAVAAEVREEVQSEYPEFKMVWPDWTLPVHSAWLVRRQLVNQYMTYHTKKYASSFVHYGGSALSYMTAGIDAVTLMVDAANSQAVHESYDDDDACARYASSAAEASTTIGWAVAPRLLDAYVNRRAYMRVTVQSGATPEGGALIIDGGLYAMSPLQFAAGMLQHGSEIGVYSLPYHPSMLVRDHGELPGTGVHYERSASRVAFIYPDGGAGITDFSNSAWHQWLVNTMRTIRGCDGCHFQFEMLGTRGCFMLIRVVKIDGPLVGDFEFVHTLELESSADLTMVKTWRLRALHLNPLDDSSWEEVFVTAPTRVVEKTYVYAMSLEPEQFSRHAIRKRLAVTNDRVVVQGTSVKVYDALTADTLDTLEIAIFTHCFVARYEVGTLSSALKRAVDDIAAYGTATTGVKLGMLMTACVGFAYDWSIAPIDRTLRDFFDRARRWLGTLPKLRGDQFLPVPQFVRYTTLVNAKRSSIRTALGTMLTDTVDYADVALTMPGWRYLSNLGAVSSQIVQQVPDLSADIRVVNDGNDLFSDVVDTSLGRERTPETTTMIDQLASSNALEAGDPSRHMLPTFSYKPAYDGKEVQVSYSYDPGFVKTLSDFHETVFPGMRGVDFKYDTSSISTDDQHRSLAADYLVLPLHMNELPSDMLVYAGKLQAYDTTKRPLVTQETLSAMQARNMAAPVLAIPQNDEVLILQIIEDFLDIACVPDAREKLLLYQEDPVGLDEQGLADWSAKARPDTQTKIIKYLLENPTAWEELKVWEYMSMIKSDVKPPLSDKPLLQRIEPQVIVHHVAVVNAIYSSLFRVLVRRFLALLKPNIMLNLLKDTDGIRDVIQTFHDWEGDVTYLENDFSKYDKSQSRFVFELERKMFELLGMNEDMLHKWAVGHVDCKISSITTGISLHVRYQRKSGDATTSFGNGMLNIMSVIHAYKGTDIVWAVFMGDDSLVAARRVVAPESAIRALAEKFNLQAKFFITMAPYMTSCFVLFNYAERTVHMVPDPVKRVEKWSMAIPARNPMWEERYQSAAVACKVYMNRTHLVGLGRALFERYGSATGGVDFDMVGDAIASAIRSPEDFRSMWEQDTTRVNF